jgi:23S rRNA (adenine2503-C2)-methyltransferase
MNDNHVAGMSPQCIAEAFELKPFQGRQLFRWVHRKQCFDLERMTDLSKDLRARLAEHAELRRLTLVALEESMTAPGTRKALFRLRDGDTVESVLIREGERRTLCLSTQVGCAVKCAFCATGLAGFKKNLTPGEVVEQALHLLATEEMGERTPNIVFMGMGEPFRNYDATMEAIRLLMHRQGLGIGARKITVSTSGDVPGIEAFSREPWQVRLSVSLHAADNALRDRLVPLNRKYPLERVLDAVKTYEKETGRQVTFEWTLMDGVNDDEEQARRLAGICRAHKASVNLIPLNPVDSLPYAPPSQTTCLRFRQTLERAGVKATLRTERGRDIQAACGQLQRTEAAHQESAVRASTGGADA